MSVLTKDFAKIIITEHLEYTTYQGESTTVLKSQTVNVFGGFTAAIPLVVAYPETASNIYTIRGIRLCTVAEVAALKEHLFAGLSEPESSTALQQLLYQGHGTPLQIFTGGNYIAAWYSELGVGFHYFVGYDASDYPTQLISASSIQKVY